MKIEFEGPLTRGRKANPRDVRRVKFALGCWGYYTPDPIFGVTGEMDEGCWKALRAFQRAHMISFTDTAGPGSVTDAGRVFTFASPPDDELPGEDYNCRCWAEPLTSSLHILAEEARREQGASSAPACQPAQRACPSPNRRCRLNCKLPARPPYCGDRRA